MQDIAKITGPNMGSLAKIQICLTELITSIPDPVHGVISLPVVFAAGKKWYDIYSTFETLSFSQKSVTTNQGKHYELTVEGFIPGHCSYLEYYFSELEQKKIVIKALDTNGHTFLVCNLKFGEIRGATLKVDYDSTSKISGLKGSKLTFSMLSSDRAYFYTATDTVTSGSGS